MALVLARCILIVIPDARIAFLLFAFILAYRSTIECAAARVCIGGLINTFSVWCCFFFYNGT
jgi:hypothetical protein